MSVKPHSRSGIKFAPVILKEKVLSFLAKQFSSFFPVFTRLCVLVLISHERIRAGAGQLAEAQADRLGWGGGRELRMGQLPLEAAKMSLAAVGVVRARN